MKKRIQTLSSVLLFCSIASVLMAATGQIGGKVLDEDTGITLPAANVRIDGTYLGAASDLQGEYLISGKSLVPVLKDSSKRVRDHAYHCFPRGGHLGLAVRTERYRLVEWWPIGDWDNGEPVYELYDYADGDVETVNLAASRPDLVSKLKAILDTYPKPADPRRNASRG